MFKKILIGVIGLIFIAGCAKYQIVPYAEVEESNYIKVKLQNGYWVEGDVIRTEPHQLTVENADSKTANLPKAEITTIQRKPPVKDDFGNGISEKEIARHKSNNNAMIYGIGGGALSAGASFFIGSLISKDMDTNGGAVLGGVTTLGCGMGSYFFLRAGKLKDRHNAIEEIKNQRVSAEYKRRKLGDPDDVSNKRKALEDEKKRQQELRKEREKLLKELNKKK
ncbi:hypothetical protein KAR48_01920 [bacterium]|nr:hypothetical protein [bacterium]